jgi:hypothetical protein
MGILISGTAGIEKKGHIDGIDVPLIVMTYASVNLPRSIIFCAIC